MKVSATVAGIVAAWRLCIHQFLIQTVQDFCNEFWGVCRIGGIQRYIVRGMQDW